MELFNAKEISAKSSLTIYARETKPPIFSIDLQRMCKFVLSVCPLSNSSPTLIILKLFGEAIKQINIQNC